MVNHFNKLIDPRYDVGLRVILRLATGKTNICYKTDHLSVLHFITYSLILWWLNTSNLLTGIV